MLKSFDLTFRKKLGKLIGQKRLAQSLTQTEVAKQLKISAQYYGRIEKGEVPCTAKAFRIIAKLIKLEKSVVSDLAGQTLRNELNQLFKGIK